MASTHSADSAPSATGARWLFKFLAACRLKYWTRPYLNFYRRLVTVDGESLPLWAPNYGHSYDHCSRTFGVGVILGFSALSAAEERPGPR